MQVAAFFAEKYEPTPNGMHNFTGAGAGGLRIAPGAKQGVWLVVLLPPRLGDPHKSKMGIVRVHADGERVKCMEFMADHKGHELQSWLCLKMVIDLKPGPYSYDIVCDGEVKYSLPFRIERP